MRQMKLYLERMVDRYASEKDRMDNEKRNSETGSVPYMSELSRAKMAGEVEVIRGN